MPGQPLASPAGGPSARSAELGKDLPIICAIIWRQHSGTSKPRLAEFWSPADSSADLGVVFAVSSLLIVDLLSTAKTGWQAKRIRSAQSAGAVQVWRMIALDPAENRHAANSATRALDVAQQGIAGIMVEAAIRLENLFEAAAGAV